MCRPDFTINSLFREDKSAVSANLQGFTLINSEPAVGTNEFLFKLKLPVDYFIHEDRQRIFEFNFLHLFCFHDITKERIENRLYISFFVKRDFTNQETFINRESINKL